MTRARCGPNSTGSYLWIGLALVGAGVGVGAGAIVAGGVTAGSGGVGLAGGNGRPVGGSIVNVSWNRALPRPRSQTIRSATRSEVHRRSS